MLDNMCEWFKINKRKLLFFIIFFIGLGTSSLWMSAIFLEIKGGDFIIGLLTISIAGVYSSAERILTLMRTKKIEGNEDLIELIAVLLPPIISIFVVRYINDCFALSATLSLILYILYCRLWWYQNRDNKNLGGNFNPIAGSAEQFKDK